MEDQSLQFNLTIQESGKIIIESPLQQEKRTLIFMHGYAMKPSDLVQIFLDKPLNQIAQQFRIVLPIAPQRNVTYNKTFTQSWYDLKTYENSFSRPFDEVFSADQIEGKFDENYYSFLDSLQIIKKIVYEELELLNNDESKLFIGGFSQGCAMSLHAAFSLPIKFGGVVSVAGYLFDITKFDQDKFQNVPFLIIHGLADKRRPWTEVKKSYNKIGDLSKIQLIEGMRHDVKHPVAKQLMTDFLKQRAKL